MPNKYLGLRRSQICIALNADERELLRVKPGSVKDRALRARRALLFEALQKKDAEIFAKWEAGYTYGKPCAD